MSELYYLRNVVMVSAMACEDSGLLDLVNKLLVFEDVKGR